MIISKGVYQNHCEACQEFFRESRTAKSDRTLTLNSKRLLKNDFIINSIVSELNKKR